MNAKPAEIARNDPRFRKIPREGVADRVTQEILGLIATGRLSPGERLPGERRLAEMMRVSRVSVRAALQRLKAQGFLKATQGGGTRVVSSAEKMDAPLAELVRISRENLHDLAEIRLILEVWAARRAALNATPAHVAEMEGILRAMRDERRRATHKADDDVRLHLAIAKASGSAIYTHIVTVIRDILREMLVAHRYQLFSTPADDRTVYAQHRAIVDAISAGDAEGAAAAMQRHLAWVLDHYKKESVRAPAAAAAS